MIKRFKENEKIFIKKLCAIFHPDFRKKGIGQRDENYAVNQRFERLENHMPKTEEQVGLLINPLYLPLKYEVVE